MTLTGPPTRRIPNFGGLAPIPDPSVADAPTLANDPRFASLVQRTQGIQPMPTPEPIAPMAPTMTPQQPASITDPAGLGQNRGLLRGLPGLGNLPGMPPVPGAPGAPGADPGFTAGASVADQRAVAQIPPGSLKGAPGVVRLAATQLGEPYVFGSENPDGSFDCSGLTKWAYSRMGVDLPHSAAQQMQTTTPVDPANLKPGMLIFYNYGRLAPGTADHVTIYAGHGRAIGSQPSTNGVSFLPVDWSNVIGVGAVPGVNYGTSSSGTRRTPGGSKPAPSSPRRTAAQPKASQATRQEHYRNLMT